MFSFSSSDLFSVGRIELTHWGADEFLTSVTWCFGQHFSSKQKVSDVQFLGVKRLKTIFFRTLFGNYKGIGGEFSGPLKVQAWACPVQRLSQTLTWPTVWHLWGIVGISAGLPWFDCGPASVSWAGTPSGTLRRSCRQGGSVPTAAGARRPVDRGEKGSGLVEPGPCFRWPFRTTFMMTGVSKL